MSVRTALSTAGPAGPAGSAGPTPTRRVATMLGLAALIAVTLAVYTLVATASQARAEDLKIFLSASALLDQRHNPYDLAQLLAREWRMFPLSGGGKAWSTKNPYVQGPLLLLLLHPLLGLPLPVAYALWDTLLAGCVGAAALLLPRVWGLPRSASLSLLLLLCPATFLGLLLGQPDALLLLAAAAALWCAERGRYATAGALITAGLIKPQIIAGLIVLLGIQAWRRAGGAGLGRYGAGLFAGGAALFAASALAAGPALPPHWARSLVAFGQQFVQGQVNISSATVLYIGWLPHALPLVSTVGAGVWLLWCVRDSRHLASGADARLRWLALGIVGWLLVTPYAHPHDDIMLFPAFIALAARRRQGTRGAPVASALLYRGAVALTWASWWLCPFPYLSPLFAPFPPDIQVRGFGIVPVLLLGVLLLWTRNWPARAAVGPAGGQRRHGVTPHRASRRRGGKPVARHALVETHAAGYRRGRAERRQLAGGRAAGGAGGAGGAEAVRASRGRERRHDVASRAARTSSGIGTAVRRATL